MFKQKENYVGKVQAPRFEQAIPYLVHKNAPEKFQYNSEEVKANFDYINTIKRLDKKISYDERLEQIRAGIADGTIRRYNFHKYITDKEYNLYKKQINNFFEYRQKATSTSDAQREVFFITGTSGSGKTTYAKMWAKKKGLSYFVSSSDNDPFDGYAGEDVVILDDLRGSSFKFSTLLKILDNNTNSSVQSRYYNKDLSECKYIIITSIFDIEDFYNNVFSKCDEPLYQLKRRCKIYIEMDEIEIKFYKFNKITGNYDYIETICNECYNFIQAKKKKLEEEKQFKELLDSFKNAYKGTYFTTISKPTVDISDIEITDEDIELFLSMAEITAAEIEKTSELHMQENIEA